MIHNADNSDYLFCNYIIHILFLSLSSDEDDEDQKRIAGKEGELQAKKVLNHYLNENGLLLNKNRSAIPFL